MSRRRVLAALGAAAALSLHLASTAPAAAQAAGEIVLDGDFTVPVTVNGVELRLRVDPAASGLVLLNAAAARRAGIKAEQLHQPPEFPSRIYRRAFARIGPVRLTGSAGVATLAIAGQPVELKLVWFEGEAVAGADGVISPEHLPYDRIVFRLRAPQGGESEHSLPLRYQLNSGLFYPYRAGEKTLAVQFSLRRASSIGTAAAAAQLAASNGGLWSGRATRERIAFGVVRPVRPMTLTRPMNLSGFEIQRFLVRTADNRGDYRLPDGTLADPDEIVVTAPVPGQPERFQLVLGSERLSACSRLVFDKPGHRLSLHCLADAAPVSAAGGEAQRDAGVEAIQRSDNHKGEGP